MEWGRFLRSAALLAVLAGCSKTAATGGLVVVVDSNGTLDPKLDTLHVEIDPADGGPPYKNADYALADATTDGKRALPVSFAIESNGDPNASVSFVVGVSNTSGSQAAETLHYVVDSLPSENVVELDVVLSAACAAQGSIGGGTPEACCPAEPRCTWTGRTCNCSGNSLPPYPAEAGQALWSRQSVSGSMDAADGGSQNATALEAGDSDLGPEGTAPDGSPDSPLDSSQNGKDGGSDAGPCEVGTTRCYDLFTPQQCTPDGQWTSLPPCSYGTTYCYEGSCLSAPRSCMGTDYSGCESYVVPGGTFLRGSDPLHDAGAPATISTFRLDAFEIPLWRFRPFVTAVIIADPLALATVPEHGTHAHLPKWLNGGGDAGVHETGWDPSWNAMFPTTKAQWDFNLSCSYSATVWPPSGNPLIPINDNLPINCVTWYEAYAFCIWDGGFLPTEAEWNYAAAGGAAQRLYPWGSTDPGTGFEYAIYGCLYPQATACNQTTTSNIGLIGMLPKGVGAFGQFALAGNVAEWTLDYYSSAYPAPCQDCAALSPTGQRVFRGGSWDRDKQFLYTSSRVPADPAGRFQDVGFRCARAP